MKTWSRFIPILENSNVDIDYNSMKLLPSGA